MRYSFHALNQPESRVALETTTPGGLLDLFRYVSRLIVRCIETGCGLSIELEEQYG